MNKLDVYFSGWGKNYLLGRLLLESGGTAFGFSAAAIEKGIEVSPLSFPLQSAVIRRSTLDATALQVPGFINDALPDGWGLIVQNCALKQSGRDPSNVTILDRLAMVGASGFGALRFVPASDPPPAEGDLDLDGLASAFMAVQSDEAPEFLGKLQQVTSPQGWRPKAAIWFNPETRQMSMNEFPGGSPWLVKFPLAYEKPDVCAIEKVYADLAARAGLQVTESRYFDLPAHRSAAFATARFDRHSGMRVPIQSFAAMLDIPNQHRDYSELFRLVRAVSHDARDLEMLFRLCVFNVVYANRDDHLKNFSFRMGHDFLWSLSPSYDLTYSDGSRGEHQTKVNGKGKDIGREDLMRLARDARITKKAAHQILDDVMQSTFRFQRIASNYRVGANRVSDVWREISANVSLIRPGAVPVAAAPHRSI